MNYENTIINLFTMLAMANAADSDYKTAWTIPMDANQRAGFFGKIYDAIECIAGIEILRHWCQTGEVDLHLANRN
jgi:hypothetical protein